MPEKGTCLGAGQSWPPNICISVFLKAIIYAARSVHYVLGNYFVQESHFIGEKTKAQKNFIHLVQAHIGLRFLSQVLPYPKPLLLFHQEFTRKGLAKPHRTMIKTHLPKIFQGILIHNSPLFPFMGIEESMYILQKILIASLYCIWVFFPFRF